MNGLSIPLASARTKGRFFAFLTGFLSGVLWLQSRPELPFSQLSVPVLGILFLSCLLGLACLCLAEHCPYCPKISRVFFILLSGFLIGSSFTLWRADIRLQDHLSPDWEGRDVWIEGTIIHLPQSIENGPLPLTRFIFRLDRVITPGAQIPQRLRLSWYGALPIPDPESSPEHVESSPAFPESRRALHPGERWRLPVRLKQAHGNSNPGGFDYEAWLLEQEIGAVGYVRRTRKSESTEGPTYLGEAPATLPLWLEQQRDHLRSALLAALDPVAHPFVGVLVGLAIGDQNSIPSSQWRLFNLTGTTHLMVVSGSHITLLAALFALLVQGIWRRIPGATLYLPTPTAARIGGWLCAVFYTGLTGFGIPAQRTVYMLTALLLAHLCRLHWPPLRLLGIALLWVLLLDPWAVLSSGFWLSFVTVGALLLLANGAVSPARHGWFGVWARSQWIATLASAPLLLFFFQQLPLISPLANLVAIPLISFMVTPLALLGMLLAILPGGWPSWILWLAERLTACLVDFLGVLAQAPLWSIPALPLWAAILAGLGILLCGLKGLPSSRILGSMCLLPAFLWPTPHPKHGEWWADLLDVGQGQALLIRTAGESLLYDSGPRFGPPVGREAGIPDAAQRVILPFLRSQGVRQLDELLISHRDSDHAGGTRTLQENLPIHHLRSPGVSLGDLPCEAGQRWTWSGVTFEILYPEYSPPPLSAGQRNNGLQSNAMSCVLLITGRQGRLLVTGDLPAEQEAALIARYGRDIQSEVLIAPHHGSRTASSKAFLSAVAPAAVLVSAGYRNHFGHPHPEAMERYAAAGIKVWRTDVSGSIQVRPALDQRGLQIDGWRDSVPRYWKTGPSALGSLG